MADVRIGNGNEDFEKLTAELEKLSQDQTTSGRADGNGITERAMAARQAQNGVRTRTPWVMSTTEWLKSKPTKAIIWGANPEDISWKMSQRATHTKNKVGTVLHVWPDPKRGTFLDEPTVTFNLQSGNIMPVYISANDEYIPAPGLSNFYDFMQLYDAPKLTNEDPPRTNLVVIQYSSNLFPKLTLIGMFDPSGGIRFNDSARNPTEVTSWSVDFIVYDTIPKLSTNSGQSSSSLLKTWIEEKITKISIEKPDSLRTDFAERPSTVINPFNQRRGGV